MKVNTKGQKQLAKTAKKCPIQISGVVEEILPMLVGMKLLYGINPKYYLAKFPNGPEIVRVLLAGNHVLGSETNWVLAPKYLLSEKSSVRTEKASPAPAFGATASAFSDPYPPSYSGEPNKTLYKSNSAPARTQWIGKKMDWRSAYRTLSAMWAAKDPDSLKDFQRMLAQNYQVSGTKLMQLLAEHIRTTPELSIQSVAAELQANRKKSYERKERSKEKK